MHLKGAVLNLVITYNNQQLNTFVVIALKDIIRLCTILEFLILLTILMVFSHQVQSFNQMYKCTHQVVQQLIWFIMQPHHLSIRNIDQIVVKLGVKSHSVLRLLGLGETFQQPRILSIKFNWFLKRQTSLKLANYVLPKITNSLPSCSSSNQ